MIDTQVFSGSLKRGSCWRFLGKNHPTRWAPTSYKWSYNPYKWPYKWITLVITLLIGVITPFITGWGPPCTKVVDTPKMIVDTPKLLFSIDWSH